MGRGRSIDEGYLHPHATWLIEQPSAFHFRSDEKMGTPMKRWDLLVLSLWSPDRKDWTAWRIRDFWDGSVVGSAPWRQTVLDLEGAGVQVQLHSTLLGVRHRTCVSWTFSSP